MVIMMIIFLNMSLEVENHNRLVVEHSSTDSSSFARDSTPVCVAYFFISFFLLMYLTQRGRLLLLCQGPATKERLEQVPRRQVVHILLAVQTVTIKC